MNIEVYKRQVHLQTNSSIPALYTNKPYQALAIVNLNASDSVDSASATFPSGSVVALDYWYESHYLPPRWQLLERDDFAGKAAMDATWGNGEYRFSIATVNDGLRSVPLSLTGDTYPNVPRIQNFNETQSVVPSVDFVLKWDAFSGGTTNDIIFFAAFDLGRHVPAFNSALPHDPSVLTGTATQVVIPAGALEPDSVYACDLWFAKVTSRNTTSYPGVLAGAAYVRVTMFYLKTGSAVTNAPPVINTQPLSQVVTWPGNVQLNVESTGATPLSYRWLRNGVVLPGATNSALSLNTGDFWNIPGVFAQAGDFRAIVTNAYGSATSQVATITAIPKLGNQPVNQSVQVGSPVSFGVSELFGSPPLTFQWRLNGVAIPGASGWSYNIPAVQSNHMGNYTLVVTNSVGAVTSAPALLTAIGAPSPPQITVQPQDSSIWAGYSDDVGFSATATGAAPLLFQWRKNGLPISSGTNSWYSFVGVQLADSGTQFDVVVANAYGSVTSRVATLTVTNAPPRIYGQSQSQSVPTGSNAVFWANADGTPPLDYQWRFNGINILGAKGPTHAVTNVQPVHAGGYTVVITNVAGAATSAVAVLNVVTNVAANGNRVLSLNGISSYVTVPDSSALRLTNGDFSVMAWVWLNDAKGGTVLAKRASGSAKGWMLHINGADQGEETRKPSFIVSAGSDPRVYGRLEFGTNRWRHLAVVYRSALSNATLYLDGEPVGTGNLPQPSSTSSLLYVGRDSMVAQYFLNGALDEVSIWNRAFTDDEVFWNMSCKRSGSEPGLVAYWNFDGGTVNDLTVHGHNGSLSGGAAVVPMNGTDVIHEGCGRPRFTEVYLFPGGQPLLTLRGEIGAVYQIEVSTNMSDWSPWVTLPNQYGTIQVIDPDARNHPRRFYRALK